MGTLLSTKKNQFSTCLYFQCRQSLAQQSSHWLRDWLGTITGFLPANDEGVAGAAGVPSYWLRDWLGTIIGFLPAHDEGVPGAAGVPEAVHPLVV